MMSVALILFSILLVPGAPAQQSDEPVPKGVIYGAVVDQDGYPAKSIALTAYPLGVGLGTMLPTTTTDLNGNYRFERIPWWGRYIVYAEDEKAGYSSFSTGRKSASQPAEVTLSPQHPEAEFNFRLPPQAGLVHIHLTNRRTGSVISGVELKVTSQEHPDQLIFSLSCLSNRPILLPPDKDLLLHISSPGYLEWNESLATGKRIRVASGSSLDLEVRLEPTG